MYKQYEAIYKKGQLQWIGSPPPVLENRRVTVLMADDDIEAKPMNIAKLLRQTRGSLGRHITIEEIDKEIRAMREEWTRQWD